MAGLWIPPQSWVESQAQLKKSGQIALNSAGIGVLTFDPENARQRWVVSSVVVSTNQSATATFVPIATLAINTSDITVLSVGNQRGSSSWSGNNDVFNGSVDVGPCDYLTVAWQPPPGSSNAQVITLNGVIASCVVTGVKYTRRA